MSELRQATATDRIANARSVAAYLRDDCRTLRDSLQLEMAAAQYALRMRDAISPESVPVGDAVAAGVVAELERHRDALSQAILRALAHVATGEVRERSDGAAARLAESGAGLPPEFADVGEAHALGAWRSSTDHPDEYAIFTDFAHPLGTRHSIGLFVEPRHGGVIKHVGLMHAMADLDLDDPFHPSALEEVTIADAAQLLGRLLERSFGAGLAYADDYKHLLAAARVRTIATEAA